MNRDFLLEIQGINTAFTASGSATAPTQWSQTLVEALASVVPMAAMDVDPYQGTFGNGGMEVLSIEGADYILDRKADGNETVLTADVDQGDATVTVSSTTGFASSGVIWIDSEAIAYASTTSTTFAACTRAQYGTLDVQHKKVVEPSKDSTIVQDFNPTLTGRKAWLSIFDPQDPVTSKVTIAVGYIEDIPFTAQGYQFSFITVAQRLEDQSIGTGINARGRLRGAITRTINGAGSFHKHAVYTLPSGQTSGEIVVELEDIDNPFPYDTSATAGALKPASNGAIKLGNEVISYGSTVYPGVSATVNNTGSGGFGPYIQSAPRAFPLRVGDVIRFTDSATSAEVTTTITRIDGSDLYHAAHSMAPAVASSYTAPGLQIFGDLTRKVGGTTAEDHEAGAEVSQAWVDTEDHVDRVLRLLTSGNESAGTYDTLPTWIGAGIPSGEIDITSFDALRPYSLPTTAIIEESTTPKALLSDLALLTGGRIFITQDGKITARRDFAPYPDTGSVQTLDINEASSIPTWSAPISQIYNQWTWEMSNGTKVNFIVDGSRRKYRPRKLPSPNKDLLIDGVSFGVAEGYAVATLLRYSAPLADLYFEIPEDETVILQPGQIVLVTFPHLPDQEGGEGITSKYFEVIEFIPNGTSVSIRLLQLPQQTRVGLVAPAAIVDSVSGADVSIKAASATYLAPTTAPSNLSDILGSGRDGTEDVDWFLDGDSIQLIDISTLGNATPTMSSVVIDTIDYPNRIITLTTTAPAWLADGDSIRLDDYLTVDANIVIDDQRIPYFTWWSDSTPALPGGDDPFQWGM